MPPRKRGAAVKRPANGAKAQTTTQSRSDEASNVGELTLPHPSSVRATEGEAKKEKNRQQPLHLTSEQQDDVIQWFQEHEFQYDKGHADYKLTERKTALWREKAQELGICDCPRLKCWVDSVRSQYGKLTIGVRGHLSERDKRILEKFSFLSRHIYRKPSRAGVDLMSKIQEKHPERMQDSQDSDEEEEVGEDKLPASTPVMSSASGETDTSAAAKRKRNPAERTPLPFSSTWTNAFSSLVRCRRSCSSTCQCPQTLEQQSGTSGHSGLVLQFRILTTLCGPSSRRSLYAWLTPSRGSLNVCSQQLHGQCNRSVRITRQPDISRLLATPPVREDIYRYGNNSTRYISPLFVACFLPCLLPKAGHLQRQCQRQQHRQR